ncbi:MAG TPA: hypothetical protein VN083_00910 [Vicinamibacteria bacterium]|jgi:hypothetical protein|nr:hypothetical protein [Vicinamibacteria bacterium]
MPLLGIRSLPASSPRKRAIEQAIMEAFPLLPGDWTVRVSPSPVSASWMVVAERISDGRYRSVILAPHRQTPDTIRADFQAAFKDLE